MKADVSVTFEYATRAPDTHKIRGVQAGGAHTLAAKAVREARRVLRPVSWVSAVVVMERRDDADA